MNEMKKEITCLKEQELMKKISYYCDIYNKNVIDARHYYYFRAAEIEKKEKLLSGKKKYRDELYKIEEEFKINFLNKISFLYDYQRLGEHFLRVIYVMHSFDIMKDELRVPYYELINIENVVLSNNDKNKYLEFINELDLKNFIIEDNFKLRVDDYYNKLCAMK